MHVRLLGPVEVTLDGRPVALGATKQRALLAMLALEANAAVPVDRLVDGLWGDDPPATARKMVQLYVSHLRRLLPAAGAGIETHGRGYTLRMDRDGVDVARFLALVEAAQRADGDHDAAGAAAREALALWRGPPLADIAAEPFAGTEIRRLEELRLTAAELAIDGDLGAGRNAAALAELTRLIAEHPLREGLHARRMLALYREGRQAEALEAYTAARARLVEDVGVEPGDELRELHDRILRQDPGLRLEPRAGPRATAAPAPAARAPAPEEADPAAAGPRRSRSPVRVPTARVLAGAAAVLILVTFAIVAVTRRDGSHGLGGISEGHLGVIDAGSGEITTQYRVSSAPQAVAGGAGSVWVANPSASTVARIRADRRSVTTIDVGGSPSALAFGGRSLWVADEDSGSIAQVDPDEDRVVQRMRVGNGLRALAVGHGALWAAAALDGEVVRIDLRSGARSHIPAGGLPVALAVGRDAVWVATEESGRVMRIDPQTATVTDGVDVGNGPTAVAVGEGAVWAANRQDGTVSRIDPATDREVASIPAGAAPSALAIAGGSVWVADSAGGAVRRIDPGGNGVDRVVRTGSAPAGLAAIDGAIWATASAPAAAHRGGTLRVARQVFDLDPASGGYNPSGAPVLELAYDGLVRYRLAPGVAGARLVPALAVDVPEPTDGGRRYVFRLRRGGRYADGTPVRARDVRTSFERMFLIQGRQGAGSLYAAIAGAQGCVTSGRSCDLSRGIVTDEQSNTVTFNLRRPDPELLPKLALQLASIVPADAPRGRSPAPLPGTGPYRVAHERRGHSALLVRNPRFRPETAGGRDPGFVDRVSVSMSDDEAPQLRAFRRGELDIAGMFRLNARQFDAARVTYGTRLRSGPFPKTVYAWLNVHAPPFDDLRVRRALNLAVDRGALVDAVGGPPAAAPTCQLLPPGFAGYRPICPFTAARSPAATWVAPDRSRAKALIAQSPRKGERVVLWVPRPWIGMGRRLQADLQDLGFPTRIRLFADLGPIGVASQDARQHPQIGLGGWIADWPEPGGFLDALVSCASDVRVNPGGVNSSRFCDHRIDRAIARAQAAGAAAGPAWQRIEEELAAKAPVVPLMNGRYPVVISERTGNLTFHPLLGPLLDAVWVR